MMLSAVLVLTLCLQESDSARRRPGDMLQNVQGGIDVDFNERITAQVAEEVATQPKEMPEVLAPEVAAVPQVDEATKQAAAPQAAAILKEVSQREPAQELAQAAAEVNSSAAEQDAGMEPAEHMPAAGEAIWEASANKTRVPAGPSVLLADTGKQAPEAGSLGTTSDLLNKPENLLGIAYAAACIIMYIIFYLTDFTTEEMLERFRHKQEKVALEYSESLDEFLRLLEKATGDNCTIAEQRFRERQRSLIRFFNWCTESENPSVSQPSSLTEPFRQIMYYVVSVWNQVSIDPIYRPMQLCTQQELRSGRSMAEIATMLVHKMQANPVNFILEDVTQSGTQAMQGLTGSKKVTKNSQGKKQRGLCGWFRCKMCTCRCTWRSTSSQGYPMVIRLPCCGLTILSVGHVFRILFLFFGIVYSQAMILIFHNALVGGAVIAGAIASLMRLSYEELVNEKALMRLEIHTLKSKKREMETRHEQIREIFSGMQAVLNLWRYQTLPRLDLVVEVLELGSWDASWHRLWISEIDTFHQLDRRFGGLGMWLGRDALQKNVLAQVGDMLNKCTSKFHQQQENVSDEAFQHLGGLFRFMVVRVLQCTNLPAKGATEAFVNIVTSGNLVSQSKRVDAKSGNPVWSPPEGPFTEQFIVGLDLNEDMFTLQVKGYDTQHRQVSMGYLDVRFSKSRTGEWFRRQGRLYSESKRKPRGAGELHIDIFPCNSVQDLAHAMKSSPEGAIEMSMTDEMPMEAMSSHIRPLSSIQSNTGSVRGTPSSRTHQRPRLESATR